MVRTGLASRWQNGPFLSNSGRTLLSWTRRLLVALILSGCVRSGRAALPAAAREAALAQAVDYYEVQALRLKTYDEVPVIRIVRSWRGEQGTYPTGDRGEPDVWCLELAVEGMRGGAAIQQSDVWIVVRNPGQAELGAGLVAAMSSLWPYEACGQMPPDARCRPMISG